MITHEPCKSHGDCYHARGGRIGNREGKARGARKTNATWGKTPEAREIWTRNGCVWAATWGKTPEAQEVKVRAGRIGGPIGGPIGGHKTQATWGKTPEAHEAAVRGGRNGNRKGKARGGCIAVESGHLARIARGVLSTADGILFRSQTEVSFYCVAQELGGKPRAYPPRIDLPDGRSYFPDFELGRSILDIPANVPIELKPARNATFYQKNLPKAIEAGAFVVYWDELVE